VRATHANGSDLVVSGDTLQFTSSPRYFGPASISFQVTDGDSAADPKGNVATIVLPITVTPRQNQPPAFTGALIDFEPGQTKTVDLTRLTSYPYAKDQAELDYTIQDPRPSGVALTLNGQKLTITVAEGTAKGASPSIAIGVKDAVNTGQAGRIELNVVPSTRPLASPQADRVIAPRGETTTVDVLENDSATNPFPGKPLKVVGVRGLASSELPAGVAITPSADNSRLSVQVSDTAAPTDVTLQYEVADATGDPDRYTWGTVTVSIQDRPEPVSNVQVTSFADRALGLSWIPGAFNNSPITGFQVTVARAGSGQVVSTTTCTTTTCVVPTPGNGTDNAVVVSVSARNALGLSDATAYAEPVWSDVVPTAPAGVAVRPLDHGLRFTWSKPADASGASAITSYQISLGGVTSSLSVGRGDAVGTGYALNVTDASIPNGASVGFSISSRNDFYAGRATWNQVQGSGVPAGAPLQTGTAPVATPSTTDGRSATLSWSGVFADNGAGITDYYAAVYEGGAAPSCTVTGVESGNPVLNVDRQSSSFIRTGSGQVTFTGLTPGRNYSFLVYAYNGQGCTASPVVSAVPRQAPSMPTDAQVTGPTDNGNGLWDFTLDGLRYTPGSGGGDTQVTYSLTGANGVSETGTLSGTSGRLTPGTGHYGTPLTLTILKICELYSGSDPICTDPNDRPYSRGIGTAVSTVIGGAHYDAASNTFTWTSWPIGLFSFVTYSCDGGATRTRMPAPGQTASCVATAPSPVLQIRVGANGTTYQHDYASDSLG